MQNTNQTNQPERRYVEVDLPMPNSGQRKYVDVDLPMPGEGSGQANDELPITKAEDLPEPVAEPESLDDIPVEAGITPVAESSFPSVKPQDLASIKSEQDRQREIGAAQQKIIATEPPITTQKYQRDLEGQLRRTFNKVKRDGPTSGTEPVNDIHSDESELENMQREQLESYPLYYENGEVITIIKGQRWMNQESKINTISSIELSTTNDTLRVGFNGGHAERFTTDELKDIFAGWELQGDGVHELERAQIGDIAKNSARVETIGGVRNRMRQIAPEEASGEQYREGQPKTEDQPAETYHRGRVISENRIPKVEVDEADITPVKTAAEAEEEKAADEARADIEEAVIQPVAPAAKEAVVEAKGEEGEPIPADADLPAAEALGRFASGEGDPPAAEAEQLEKIRVGESETQPPPE